MNPRVVLLLISFVTALRANAQEPTAAAAAESDKGWSGKVALGYLATSGNTESSSLNSGFGVAYAVGRWLHGLELKAIYATEDEQTTAESYSAAWKSEFNLTDRDFLFGRVNWRKDRFSGYDQQLSESVGYGRRLIDTGVHFLNAEIGAGARQSDLVDGTSESDVILRAGVNYLWQFTETAAFTQDLITESGEENTYIESTTALRASLIGDLALVASYTIKNNSEVPAGSENTDRLTALSLEYAF
jgi:putative salt-induced outer membrane protein